MFAWQRIKAEMEPRRQDALWVEGSITTKTDENNSACFYQYIFKNYFQAWVLFFINNKNWANFGFRNDFGIFGIIFIF